MLKQEKETISGAISSIRFRSSEGFAIFDLEISGKDGPITCKGFLPETTGIGDVLQLEGNFAVDNKWGKQFSHTKAIPEKPDTNSSEGVKKLLQRLPGIGPVKAEEAIIKLGHKKAWESALNDPSLLGIKDKEKQDKVKYLAASLTINYESIIYLLGIGLTDRQTSLVIGKYGEHAIAVVSQDPYKLIEIDSFGFMTVDGIALQAGIAPGNQSRIMACVMFILNSSEADGNVYFPGKVLAAKVQDFLLTSAEKHRVPLIHMPGFREVRDAIMLLRDEDKVVVDDGLVYGKKLLNDEKTIMDAFAGEQF